jgi:polyvinyl alcohol dehydrogenase (cytochrome)
MKQPSKTGLRRVQFTFASMAYLFVLTVFTSVPVAGQDWPMGGQNLSDTRNQPFESTIGPSNVNQLAVKWSFPTGGGVGATPAVVNGVVYFPDRGGNFTR